MNKDVLTRIIEDLRVQRTPTLSADDFPCFFDEATAGSEHVSPQWLDELAQSLSVADIPTFERACQALDEGDIAWLGFKVVYDAAAAQQNVDNDVTKKYGDVGSADGLPLVFFCNDAKEIVSARTPSPRDIFQMKDVTRGPSMHNDQFSGLTWVSLPLFHAVRVWLLGASDVAAEVARLASHVGFLVNVIDCDASYLSEERFPDAKRILLSGDNFDELDGMSANSSDYVCVLTRGHVFDPESCLWAVRQGVHYIGMMGCAGKNNTVYTLVRERGLSDDEWERIKRPIGLAFGAKTPAELAIAIVGELVDVRYCERYSQEARQRHEQSLGRVP